MFEKIIFILFCIVILNNPVFSETSYESLREKYFTLRNIDYQFAKQSKWVEVIVSYNYWIKRREATKNKGEVFLAKYHLAQIHCELEINKIKLKVSKSCEDQLNKFVKKYSDNLLADDALMSLVKFYENTKNFSKVKECLEIIVNAYPDSDMADVASLKLELFNSGGSFNGSGNKKLNKDLPLVVIDPGHGGEDYGAIGKENLYEKDVVLSISYKLKKLLETNKIASVYLTRTKDEFVPLAKRTAIANELKADLFLSVHVNASQTKRNSGLEIYYLDNKFGEASAKLASRENESVSFEGVQKDVYLMLADLIQDTKKKEAITLAKTLEVSILKNVRNINPKLVSLGVRKAPFYVLIGAHMPCVLLELFYIDHKVDGVLLSQNKFREELANGVYSGIKDYLEQLELKSS